MEGRHRVVIVGSGFGGLSAARALRRADIEVTLVAATTHHLFQPLLYQVATGILSEGEIAPSTRMVLRNQANVKVILGEVTDIDLKSRTVTSDYLEHTTVTAYDSLIVAAGAQQSYFGNDHFAEHAPGMKTIDDALELRGRILGAFEEAELCVDKVRRERLLTFVVVGAGPTGVEMAGQIAELAHRTLPGAYRGIDPRSARVILLDAASQVLPTFGPRLGGKAQIALQRLGVDVRLSVMVNEVDSDGLVVQRSDGIVERIEASCKVWSAGVAASPLGATLADQSGAGLDRAGRIQVESDLTVPGYPEVFVVGDMIALDGLPGVAPLAVQSGRHAARTIAQRLDAMRKNQSPPAVRSFRYRDKGSMATICRFKAVAKIGGIELTSGLAWLTWLAVHLVYLVGYRSRLAALLSWTVAFFTRGRGQMAITRQQVEARAALATVRKLADIAPRDPDLERAS